MSFNFSWDSAFSPSFLDKAKTILETALNKGNTPALIVGKIEVRELDMGVIPPTLTLLEIGDLQPDRFRGIFRLGYAGDAHLVVGARVQANPLSPSPSPFPLTTTPLAAHRPLLVPMALRLSNLKLRAIVVLVVSKQKGITLVFKNDPLESLEVSSTFDSIGVLKGFIQREIEGQLREMFREDLPGIIHTLSQQWFTGEAASATGSSNVPFTSNLDSVVGRPSSGLSPPPPSSSSSFDNNNYSPPSSPPSAHSIPEPLFPPHSQPIPQRSAPRRAPASSPNNRHLSPLASSPTATSTFPDLEQYDPTYGLRPEGVPTHSVVTGLGLGRRWERNRGLGHFVDGSADGGEEGIDGQGGDEGYELVGYEEGDGGERAAGGSYYDHNGDIDSTPPRREYETIPAVGGGTVTRPRVYLSQSFIRPPESSSGGGGGGGSSVWGGGGWESPSSGSAAASGSTTTARVSTAPTITRNDSWRNSSTGGEMGRGGASSPSPAPRMAAGRRNTGSIGPGGSQPFAFPPSSSSTRPGVSRYDSSLPLNGQRPSTPSYPSSHTTPTRPSKTLQHSNSSPPGQFPLHHHQAHYFSSSLNPSTSNHSSSTHNTPPLSHSLSTTPSHSSNSISTPPSSFPSSSSNQPHQRSPSTSQGLPETISHLSMLSISNQTLSPYTREHAHIAVRSQPQIFRSNSLIGPGDGSYSSSSSSFLPPPPGGGPRKARRKRIHRLGGATTAVPTNESNSVSPESMPPTPSNSPPQPPSEWDYDSISVVGERLHHQQQQQQQGVGSSSVASRSGAGGGLRSRPRLTPKASYGFPSTVPAPKGWESGGGFSGRFKSSVVKT